MRKQGQGSRVKGQELKVCLLSLLFLAPCPMTLDPFFAFAQPIDVSSDVGSQEKALREEGRIQEPKEKEKKPEIQIEEEEGEKIPPGVPFFSQEN